MVEGIEKTIRSICARLNKRLDKVRRDVSDSSEGPSSQGATSRKL